MGFEDRDYSQEEWNAGPSNDNLVTKWFVILTVVLFVFQLFTIRDGGSAVYELASLKTRAVLQGQIWRLFTFVICNHPADILGLVFNLLIAWRFGTDLERMYGSRELGFYIAGTTLFVGLSFTAWGLAIPNLSFSGPFTVALGLLTLFATHFPRTEVYILPLISIQLRWLVAIYALCGAYPSILAMQQGAGILALAYATSVFSIPFALAYRRFGWHFSGIVGTFNVSSWRRAWRNRLARRSLKVFQPAAEANLDSNVDAILAKIHEHGSESLTDAERSVLARASERYKKRS